MPRSSLNQLARRTRAMRLAVSPAKTRMWGRQLRGSCSWLRSCSREKRVSASQRPARTSPQRLLHGPPPHEEIQEQFQGQGGQAGGRADQEHHRHRAQATQQRHVPGHPDGGPVGGVPGQLFEGGAQVDGHVEGQEQDRDKLGDLVQAAQQDGGQGDGAADPGGQGGLAGGRQAGQEARGQTVLGKGLQHAGPAQGAAESRREDRSPQTRKDQPGPEKGQPCPGVNPAAGQGHGVGPESEQERDQDVDQGTGHHRQ